MAASDPLVINDIIMAGFNDPKKITTRQVVSSQPPLTDIKVDDFVNKYRIESHFALETIIEQLQVTCIQVGRILKNWLANKINISLHEAALYTALIGYLTRAKLETIYTSPDSLKEMSEKTKHKLELKKHYEIEASKLLKDLCGLSLNLQTLDSNNFKSYSLAIIK